MHKETHEVTGYFFLRVMYLEAVSDLETSSVTQNCHSWIGIAFSLSLRFTKTSIMPDLFITVYWAPSISVWHTEGTQGKLGE
jgi:hypothetical protein